MFWKIGDAGFGHAGSVALHFANDEDNNSVAASVAYYPGCSKLEKAMNGLFGDRRNFDDPKIHTKRQVSVHEKNQRFFCLVSALMSIKEQLFLRK